MFRPAQFLALLAALQILGGHWIVVQSVAWVSMFVEYSQTAAWEEALSKTFDGKHPCKLCSEVQRGSAGEKTPQSLGGSAKWEAVLGEEWMCVEPVFRLASWSLTHLRASMRSEAPGVPPPRA